MTQLATRAITPADEPFLLDLFASTREELLAMLPVPEAQKGQFLLQQFAAQQASLGKYPDADFQIVLLDDEPIGRRYLSRSDELLWLVDLSLLPSHRGRGLGGRLLDELAAQADSAVIPVALHVERANPAQRLYARHGFRITATDQVHFRMERAPQPIS